jgi:hypothetical protein
MRLRARLKPLTLALALASTACIEDHLTVDINTIVHGDGSCTRHVVYQLERTAGENDAPADLATDQDPIALYHRFPSGESWTVVHDARARTHTVTLDATLPSPNEVDWDYWRRPSAKGTPARNHFSFAMTGPDDDLRYQYSETFLDPASPLQAMRALAQLLAKKDGEFALDLQTRLELKTLSRPDVARAFRETLAEPFLKDVAAIASRPVYGPRERNEIEKLMDLLTAHQKDLAARLARLAPSVGPEALDQALDKSADHVGEDLRRQLEEAGLPLSSAADSQQPIHFRATLVMPAPIVRANTCAQGDTATWEFDADDLYGHGFEMWAVAASR